MRRPGARRARSGKALAPLGRLARAALSAAVVAPLARPLPSTWWATRGVRAARRDGAPPGTTASRPQRAPLDLSRRGRPEPERAKGGAAAARSKRGRARSSGGREGRPALTAPPCFQTTSLPVASAVTQAARPPVAHLPTPVPTHRYGRSAQRVCGRAVGPRWARPHTWQARRAMRR